MNFNCSFFEAGNDIHPVFHEQDANTDITGDWIAAYKSDRVYIRLKKGGSEDVDDLGLQLLQATDAAGAGAKALQVARCWYKTGTMTGQGTWTAVTLTSPSDFLAFGSTVPSGATRVVADVNTSPLELLVEIITSSLDTNNGFKFVTAFVEGDNVDNTCLLSCDAILFGSRFDQAVPLTPLA